MLDLESIDAQCFQNGNPGGNKKAFSITSRRIVGDWPNEAVIDENGVITELPILLPKTDGTEVKWAQYLFPNGTCQATSDSGGDNSYQSYKHGVELALAGFEKARKEARKHLNAGSVWIIQQKGGEYVVVGSSDDPIFIKSNFTTGKKGSDKRGYTFKGESEGMIWDLPILPADLVAQLEFEPVPLED